MLKRELRRGIGCAAGLLLPPVGAAFFRLAAVVEMLYRRSWPTRDITYYDQRFAHLAGPGTWRAVERGIIGASFLRPHSRLLDLCCGDGTFDRYYFAPLCAEVVAVDRDPSAIHLASRVNRHPKIRWIAADVATEVLPGSDYHAVFMFASLQYFTLDDAVRVMNGVAAALLPGGVFVGSVPEEVHANQGKGDKSGWNEGELKAFLKQHFDEATV